MSSSCSERTSGRTSCDVMARRTLKDIEAHLFHRDYMGGIERDEERIKATGEVFTPKRLVDKMLKRVDSSFFEDPTKTFLDPACGDGEFLAGVLWRKLIVQRERQKNFRLYRSVRQALGTLYGVDIKGDNVRLCQSRLLCGYDEPELLKIVENNIIERDALLFFEPQTRLDV